MDSGQNDLQQVSFYILNKGEEAAAVTVCSI